MQIPGSASICPYCHSEQPSGEELLGCLIDLIGWDNALLLFGAFLVGFNIYLMIEVGEFSLFFPLIITVGVLLFIIGIALKVSNIQEKKAKAKRKRKQSANKARKGKD